MIQAIVFLPLIGAILAGVISIVGAHARNPSGDEVEHPRSTALMRMRLTPMTNTATITVTTTITQPSRRRPVHARPN